MTDEANKFELPYSVIDGSFSPEWNHPVEQVVIVTQSQWMITARSSGIFNVNDVLFMFADAMLDDGEYFPAITAVLKHDNQHVVYWSDDEGFDNRDDAVQIARENMDAVLVDFQSRLSGGGRE